jgi:hypothetical protein
MTPGSVRFRVEEVERYIDERAKEGAP